MESLFGIRNPRRSPLRLGFLEGAPLFNLEGAPLGLGTLEGVPLKLGSLEGAPLGLINLEGAPLESGTLEGAHLGLGTLEGIQFRLHCLQAPEDTWPDRFNEDGIEKARLTPVENVREHLRLDKIYERPPKHAVDLNYKLLNNISLIAEAKRQLREYDLWKQAAAG
uniref:Uncharacterized protein n=1 Tax=Cacopsylla melanoneura TaxID=428564 RepID=A0A8D8VHC4_9HEMI